MLLFSGLDAAVVEEVLAGARRRTFQRGDVVFHAGDPGDSVQLIARGHFALRLVTPRGDLCMTRVFGPGDMFGRVALGTLEAVREATVISLDESETFELFRRQIDELRAAHPAVSVAGRSRNGVGASSCSTSRSCPAGRAGPATTRRTSRLRAGC